MSLLLERECGFEYPENSEWGWFGVPDGWPSNNEDAKISSDLDKALEEEEKLRSAVRAAAKRQRFLMLSREWKRETRFISSITEKSIHPAYQNIIGMGEDVVPLILADLSENGPDDWFWALTAITDENPITEDFAGNMQAMTEAWLQWGRQRGLLKGSQKMTKESFRTF